MFQRVAKVSEYPAIIRKPDLKTYVTYEGDGIFRCQNFVSYLQGDSWTVDADGLVVLKNDTTREVVFKTKTR